MVHYLQYIIPIVFIIFGFYIQSSNDPRWNSSKKMSKFLIILGIITLLGRIALDYSAR